MRQIIDGVDISNATHIGGIPLSGFTDGSVLFFDSGVVSQDNANLYWDDATNRLGIGTNSPSTTFHVSGKSTLGGRVIVGANNISRSDDTKGIYLGANGEMGLGVVSPGIALGPANKWNDTLYVRGSQQGGYYTCLLIGQRGNSGGGMMTYNETNGRLFMDFAGWDSGTIFSMYYGGGGWGANAAGEHLFYTTASYNADETGSIRVNIGNTNVTMNVPLAMGANTITTTGQINAGALDVDNVFIDSNTIASQTGQLIISDRTIVRDVGAGYNSPYTFSIQSTTGSTWFEILNSTGAGKGSFFGSSGFSFELYNYNFYTDALKTTFYHRDTKIFEFVNRNLANDDFLGDCTLPRGDFIIGRAGATVNHLLTFTGAGGSFNFQWNNTDGGVRIGTATSQKLGFWNTAAIVQPTTGIAAATFVANTSGIVNDTATWDGYTIGQVVKALRNVGLLA